MKIANNMKDNLEALIYYRSFSNEEREYYRSFKLARSMFECAEHLIQCGALEDRLVNKIVTDPEFPKEGISYSYSLSYGDRLGNDKECKSDPDEIQCICKNVVTKKRGQCPCFDKEIFCYQCRQIYFLHVLSELEKGYALNDINGFNEISNIAFMQKLRNKTGLPIGLTFDDEFHSIFYSDLIDYLCYNNQRKIKKCKNCGNYHLRSTDKEISSGNYFCTSKCRYDYKNRQKKPEENRDAVKKSRQRKREVKKSTEKESRIKRMMKLGWSRDQAEEFLDLDD